TTLPAAPPCVGFPTIDPDGTVTALVRGQTIDIPVRVTSTNGGQFNVFLYDQDNFGTTYCPQNGCGPHVLATCGDTLFVVSFPVPPTAPASMNLVARADPYFFPFACGLGSQ